jgi:hypothetical protein
MSETNMTQINEMPRADGDRVMRYDNPAPGRGTDSQMKADADATRATRDAMKYRMRDGWKGEDHPPAAEPRSYAEYKADLTNAWKGGR